MTIIAGALQLTQKIAKDTMTPISYTFEVDINAKLDRYDTIMSNYLALVLVLWMQVKNLLTTHSVDKAPVKSVTIHKILRYIICVEKGHNHMAVVIRTNGVPVEQQESKTVTDDTVKDVRVGIDGSQEKYILGKRPILKWKSFPSSANNSYKGIPKVRNKKWDKDILQIDEYPLPKLAEEEEAVGIIRMDNVIGELLQANPEEIFDETDNYYKDS
ncbi:hypothetical protein GIB67_022720 [Kingdonia uniflora]|uniref:Uncharacterized protein n=1 Tax=Kingdonia uniflora TaxID=39325 RepID=A0A7J7P954_9MAGN|nr:hypothetical protein GIB67_022720 [Kingdonia uniflora]